MNQTSISPPCELQINLKAIVENWRRVQAVCPDAECAAVVKADAYGLGSKAVVATLAAAGCRSFYVATFDEAEAIRPLVADGTRICMLNGLQAHELAAARQTTATPVLSSLTQVAVWLRANQQEGRVLPCIVHVDTGMNRLGLDRREWRQLLDEVKASELGVIGLMSHLACAEDSFHPMNENQRQRFDEVLASARRWAPGIRASLANSAGALLAPSYHYDEVRSGIALYGGNPDGSNRFSPAVHLRLPILQLRRVSEAGTVGYGAGSAVKAGALLATVQGGYADGLLRSQSSRAQGEIAGTRVPMLGRVSMDLCVFDVTAVPRSVWQTDEPLFVDVLNDNLTIDEMANAAGTISYEVLTRLGQRFRRYYIGEQIESGVGHES